MNFVSIFRLLLLQLLFWPMAMAQNFHVISFGSKPYDYSQSRPLPKIEVGDYVQFEWTESKGLLSPKIRHHKIFRLGRLLGTGATSLIYEIYENPDVAIRIPKDDYYLESESFPTRGYLYMWYNGHKALENAGVPIPKILDYGPGQFILVERLYSGQDHDLTTFYDFINHPENFSEDVRNKMKDDLIRFAKKTASFRMFSDFHSRQLAYDIKRGWVLIDWTEFHKKANHPDDPNVFENMLDRERTYGATWRNQVFGEIYLAIKEVRKNLKYKKCFWGF